jgi:hypothetical protein
LISQIALSLVQIKINFDKINKKIICYFPDIANILNKMKKINLLLSKIFLFHKKIINNNQMILIYRKIIILIILILTKILNLFPSNLLKKGEI